MFRIYLGKLEKRAVEVDPRERRAGVLTRGREEKERMKSTTPVFFVRAGPHFRTWGEKSP